MANIQLPEKLGFLFEPARYKIAYGGRGAAKSWGFARALLIQAATAPLRILCAREVQNSIADSVHRLLSDQIVALGLETFFRITQTAMHTMTNASKVPILTIFEIESMGVNAATIDTVTPIRMFAFHGVRKVG